MSEVKFEGQVALVTGASRGIGAAIALALAERGLKVIGTATSDEGAAKISQTLAAFPGCRGQNLNVNDAAGVDAVIEAIVKEHGGLQILVNNAGITRDTLLMRMTDEEFEEVINTNLNGVFRVLRRATKGMIKARFGRVILIGSVVGLLGSAGQVNYSAAKSALVGMARSVTRELGARGITANVVAPGFIDTDMTAELPEAQQEDYKKRIPAGRFAAPQEVAKVVAWLAGDDAAYISGAVIPVDGGLGMGH